MSAITRHGDLETVTPFVRHTRFFLEGIVLAGLGLLLTARLGGREAGVFAIFLAAAALTSRMQMLLDENRENIWSNPEMSSERANLLTTSSVFAIFVGICVAFAIAAALHGSHEATARFSVLLEAADLGSDTILSRSFGSFTSIVTHNFAVLASVFVLAFIYRIFGLLIALVWNSAIWALVLTVLVQRAIEGAEVSAWMLVPVAFLGVLPHLVLEAAAYILVALAGVYAMTGLTKYGPGDKRARSVAIAVAKLCALAIVALVLGALLECTLPAAIFALLSS